MFRSRMFTLAAVALLSVLSFGGVASSQAPGAPEPPRTVPGLQANVEFQEFVKTMNALDPDTSKIYKDKTKDGLQIFSCALYVTHGNVKHRVIIYYVPGKEIEVCVILSDRLTPSEEAELKVQALSYNLRQDKKSRLSVVANLHTLFISGSSAGNVTCADIQAKLTEVLAGVDETQDIWIHHRSTHQ